MVYRYVLFKIIFDKNDPAWFEKKYVTMPLIKLRKPHKYICRPYVMNIYRAVARAASDGCVTHIDV